MIGRRSFFSRIVASAAAVIVGKRVAASTTVDNPSVPSIWDLQVTDPKDMKLKETAREMEAFWAAVWGDPNDPVVRARIEEARRKLDPRNFKQIHFVYPDVQ